MQSRQQKFNTKINKCESIKPNQTCHTTARPLHWHTQQFRCIATSSVCTIAPDRGTHHFHRNLHSVSNGCQNWDLLSVPNTFIHLSISPCPKFCLKLSCITDFPCIFNSRKLPLQTHKLLSRYDHVLSFILIVFLYSSTNVQIIFVSEQQMAVV